MAAPGENLLSVEPLTSMQTNTLTKQRDVFIKKRRMQLQQHLQELKERERRAQQHNRQLLLQFERAQDTLREMLAHSAAMKTIRMEYERYLEENFPRWQHQLQEKTRASHKKRRDDCLKSYLQHDKDQVSTADEPLTSQDPSIRATRFDAPQMYPSEEISACTQDNPSYYPHPESSWLTQGGMFPGFFRASVQTQDPLLVPPTNFPHSHTLLGQNLPSVFNHQQPWFRPEAGGCAPLRCIQPCTDGKHPGRSGQMHTEKSSASSVSQIVEREDASSKRLRGGGGRRCISPELDVKPVRLSSGHAESSESGRDSSFTSREMKKGEKKRGRAKPSESERFVHQKTSRTPSEAVSACCAVARVSDTNSPSEEGETTSRRTKRGRRLNTGSEEEEECNGSGEDEQSDSLGEKGRSPGIENELGSCRGEEGSDSEGVESENKVEHIDDEVLSSEQSNTEEKDEEEKKKNPGSGDKQKENRVTSEQESNVEDGKDESNDEVPSSTNQKEYKGEDEEEDEERSVKLENEDKQQSKKDSATSDDEDEESDGSEKIMEHQAGSTKEKEQPASKEEEDSEDSIISPQDKNRSKQAKSIPEEAVEDEEEDESQTQSSNNNSKESSDEEDIENLLAPQDTTEKKETSVKTEMKPKATCLNLSIFQVTENEGKTNQNDDSDEFDHFYD